MKTESFKASMNGKSERNQILAKVRLMKVLAPLLISKKSNYATK